MKNNYTYYTGYTGDNNWIGTAEPSEAIIPVEDNNPVTHPSHYTQGKYEVIDVIYDWDLPYPLDNTVKYIARFRYKDNPLEDLKKAQFYLDYYIKKMEEEQND